MSAPAYGRDAYQEAREGLVRSLSSEITDVRVLEAFRKVPRERFVPVDLRAVAYSDRPLPIGQGQTISQPLMVAMMLQELALKGHEKVLDIGTGSGYQAALLAELAREVVTVERIEPLSASAKGTLDELGYRNVRVELAGDTLGWPDGAPYDAIVVGAAGPRIPQSLVAQLGPTGRIVMPVGGRKSQDLMVLEKTPEDTTVRRRGACRFVPLIGKDAFDGADADDPDLEDLNPT
jgi:protein-L-isoaspartate(D-aspartate) O-methyltransferase